MPEALRSGRSSLTAPNSVYHKNCAIANEIGQNWAAEHPLRSRNASEIAALHHSGVVAGDVVGGVTGSGCAATPNALSFSSALLRSSGVQPGA